MPTDHPPAPGQSPVATHESYSIVIADDDQIMAKLLAANLTRLGHRVAGIARNGREAVDMTLKTRPDVVVMDIHMPVLDGLQAANEILAVHTIPIVLSTGLSDSRTVCRALKIQVVSYLVKPFSPAQLNVAVHLAVARCRALVESGDATAPLRDSLARPPRERV